MYLRLKTRSVGVGLPFVGGGFNLYSSIDLGIRTGKNGPLSIFRISRSMELASGLSEISISALETDWFWVDSIKNKWICDLSSLLDKTLKIELVSLAFGSAQADFKISILDVDKDIYKPIFARATLKVYGVQTQQLNFSGKLSLLSGHLPEICQFS